MLSLPLGSIIAYAGSSDPDPSSTAPSTWMICDGRAFIWSDTDATNPYYYLKKAFTDSQSNCTYPFGIFTNGDNLPCFVLPDFRGRFLRGADDAGNGNGATNRDPDADKRTAMSTDPNKNPIGNSGNKVGSCQGFDTASHTHTSGYYDTTFSASKGDDYGHYVNPSNPSTANSSTGAFGGNETRPVNAYVNYIMRVK